MKQFTHAPREDHVATRYLVEFQKVFVIVVVEGPIRVNLRHVHRIADDAVRARVCARRYSGRIHAGHRGKNGVPIQKVDALEAKSI